MAPPCKQLIGTISRPPRYVDSSIAQQRELQAAYDAKAQLAHGRPWQVAGWPRLVIDRTVSISDANVRQRSSVRFTSVTPARRFKSYNTYALFGTTLPAR